MKLMKRKLIIRKGCDQFSPFPNSIEKGICGPPLLIRRVRKNHSLVLRVLSIKGIDCLLQ